MPRYNYFCKHCESGIIIVHTISECDQEHKCTDCGHLMNREIEAPHIEGSNIYPFNLWNLPLPNGQEEITVHNKDEHKALMKKYDCDTPYLHVGG